ncbi:hypothetical protein RHGRI_026341 [Rhododendron griersonianum]|uniref:Uncharacterized protein n=1 Tax=Rhododendron griersonianum TaxID=479676 RepID=A0AAV6IUQ7_9ERIC|nr:hypothetical protein RHGRI_026341 [Rhododendron griersonianum]
MGTLIRTTGLGYLPSGGSKVKKGERLEDYFIKEKAKQVYQGQPEPLWDKETNTLLPGFEIFANDVRPESEEEFEAAEEWGKLTDWIEVFNMGSLTILFEENGPMGTATEAEVLMLGQEALKDPTSLIMDAAGDYKNWTFILSVTCHGPDSDSESSESSQSSKSFEFVESESVPLGPTPHGLYFEFESTHVYGAREAFADDKINESDSASFPGFEINCVNPDDQEIDFDGDIPKEIRSLVKREDERHAQPIKEEEMKGIPK